MDYGLFTQKVMETSDWNENSVQSIHKKVRQYEVLPSCRSLMVQPLLTNRYF